MKQKLKLVFSFIEIGRKAAYEILQVLHPWDLVLIVEFISSANALYFLSCLTPLFNAFILFQ